MDHDPLRDHVVLEQAGAVAAELGGVELGAGFRRTRERARPRRARRSGTPTTAASRTPGAECSTSSTSRGTTFSPPRLDEVVAAADEVQVAVARRSGTGRRSRAPAPTASVPAAAAAAWPPRVAPVALHHVRRRGPSAPRPRPERRRCRPRPRSRPRCRGSAIADGGRPLGVDLVRRQVGRRAGTRSARTSE